MFSQATDIRELKQQNDGDGYENVTQKVNSRCLKLNRTYSISFNSSRTVSKFRKKKKVVALCFRPRQNVKLDIFTL